MTKVLVTQSKLDTLAEVIGGKSNTNVPLTVDEMITAADSITGGGSPVIDSLSVTPSESEQTFNSSSVDGYKPVTVAGIPSDYVGSGITRRDSTDLEAEDEYVIVPAGYYKDGAAKQVAFGTAGTPTASKGAVNNHAISVTPSVTNSAGYITGGTKTGTAVSVSASELVSGTYTVDSSGTKDVTNYESASVPSGAATPASSITGSSATVSTGTNTLTLSKTVSNTPQVSAGYISSGTAGNSNVSLTASVTTKGATTYTPTTTNQTISSGTYLTGTQTISGDANLVAGNIKSGTTIFGVTGTYSGGGGSVSYDTKTATASNYPVSLEFTSMKGEPKAFVCRLNAQVSSSGNTTYYYIVDVSAFNTTTHGNCFRIGSTRRVDNITSGYSWSYSGTTLTITSSAASRSASPGAFYSGSYELLYIY